MNMLKEHKMMCRRFVGFWGLFKEVVFLWRKGLYEPKPISKRTSRESITYWYL